MKTQTENNCAKCAALHREEGDKFFVLADVHSFFGAMTRALEEKGFDLDNPHHKVILLGDMFDRGDAAEQTFKFFKSLGNRLTFVKGNHEDLLERCINAFKIGIIPNDAHFLNGTVNTVMQFCGIDSFEDHRWIYEAEDVRRILQLANRIDRALSPVLEYIASASVDYATLDNYVFVHGYIPCFYDNALDKYFPVEDWKNGDWYRSRWEHGTKAWHDGVRADGLTVVCGHWHTSEAHYLYHDHGSEWGDDADFSPFVDDGIIAMDANTAFSGKCNCIVL